jgi:hypothetical protein
MKPNAPSPAANPPAKNIFPLALAVSFFALGALSAGLWFHHHEPAAETSGLSAQIQNLVSQLPQPATVRFYSLLPAGSADSSLQSFAGRVSALLDTFQGAGNGKLNITTVDATSDTNTAAATTDGIEPFNLDKGEACFLGLVVTSGKNREVIARLQPEWESALPFDLARAIEQTTKLPPPPKPAPEVAKPSPEIISSIHRLIPDIQSTSAEDASRIFHGDYVSQCALVGSELESELATAQEQMNKAQNGGSDADIEAARKHLQEIQIAQGEKLKQIASQLQTELAVFQQMKATATNAAK